ncbi:Peptidyl-prolyl cis-trans isomerase FKBP43 [Bienertia sinuspersici]
MKWREATLGTGSTTLQVNVGDKSPVFLCKLLPDNNSYGEDIRETNSDSSGYESKDDDAVDMFPPSAARKSGVDIEEIVDDEKCPSEDAATKQAKMKKKHLADANKIEAEQQIVEKLNVRDPVLEDGGSARSLKRKVDAINHVDELKSDATESANGDAAEKKTKKKQKKRKGKTEKDDEVANVKQDPNTKDKSVSKTDNEGKQSNGKRASGGCKFVAEMENRKAAAINDLMNSGIPRAILADIPWVEPQQLCHGLLVLIKLRWENEALELARELDNKLHPEQLVKELVATTNETEKVLQEASEGNKRAVTVVKQAPALKELRTDMEYARMMNRKIALDAGITAKELILEERTCVVRDSKDIDLIKANGMRLNYVIIPADSDKAALLLIHVDTQLHCPVRFFLEDVPRI